MSSSASIPSPAMPPSASISSPAMPPASIPSRAMPPSTPTPFPSPSPSALPPIPSPSPSPAPSLDLPPLLVGLIAGIIGGVLLCVVFVPCLVLHIINKWHQHRDRVSYSPSESVLPNVVPCKSLSFNYEELASATNGFAYQKVLGQGAFGAVYQGTLNDGKEVAIKKLNPDSHQGEQEFRAEVNIISRVHHRNLVTLIGYCIHDNQRLLVYEFAPNKTLRFHLHESDQPIDWPKRWKIALDSAKGLAYLHEDCDPKVIHGDIKSANILVDLKFEPKIADFGLAKFVPPDMSYVFTEFKGTIGYIAPENVTCRRVTDRSDVYSYGVILLELITGKQPVMHEDQSLVFWVRTLLSEATDNQNLYDELIDKRLQNNYDRQCMTRLLDCAAAAVRRTPNMRPTMHQIVRYLEGKITLMELHAGSIPGTSAEINSLELEALRRMAWGDDIDNSNTENIE